MAINLKTLTGGMTAGHLGASLRSGKKSGLKIAFCGDSITQDAVAAAGKFQNWGWVTWLRRYLCTVADIQKTDVFAVAGMGTEHLLATQMPQLLAGNYDYVICMIGTNDTGDGLDIIANLNTFYNAVQAKGIIPIALPILPHTNRSTVHSQEAEGVNRWLYKRSLSDPMFYFINTLPSMTDYTTGFVKSGVLRDTVHTNKVGAKTLADVVVANLPFKTIDTTGMNLSTFTRPYHQQFNRGGDFLPNGRMIGTTGLASGVGMSGVVATDWRIKSGIASPTTTGVGSKGTRTDVAVGQTQIITLGGTANSDVMTLEALGISSALPETLTDGSLIRLEADITTSGLTGVRYVTLALVLGAELVYDGELGGGTSLEVPAMSATHIVEGTWNTGEAFGVRVLIGFEASGAVAGTVTVKDVRLTLKNQG